MKLEIKLYILHSLLDFNHYIKYQHFSGKFLILRLT